MPHRNKNEADRRRYPRKPTRVKVKLAAAGRQGLSFEAHLPSADVSIGGIFLESEFFVKLGTELRVTFELDQLAESIEAIGRVVREQRDPKSGRSGFAIEFTEYVGEARQALATYFLAPEIRAFVEDYRSGGRSKRIRGEQERMVDLIVAWEIDRLDRGHGPFRA
jgi:c-di-GMP-binding flagellar brake protein YcgR